MPHDDRQRDRDDWARQVPDRRDWERGPYRDWGWDQGQSSLPAFRDPSVHLTDEEWREVDEWRRRQGGDFDRFTGPVSRNRPGGPRYAEEPHNYGEWEGQFEGRGFERREDWRSRQGRQDDDWARQVPDWRRRNRGPYRNWGWEQGQSTLPEFRDPSVHLTEEEWREVEDWRQREGGDFDRFTGPVGRRTARPRREQRKGQTGPRRLQDFSGRPGPGRRGYFGEPYGEGYAPEGYYGESVLGRGFDDQGRFSFNRDWDEIGPYAGVGPRGYQRPDDRIHEEVCEILTQHGLVDASEVEIRVQNGEVTLEGSIPSRKMKRMAEDALEDVSGVEHIQNNLRIQRAEFAQTRQQNLGQAAEMYSGRSERNRQGGQGAQNRTDRVGDTGVYPASGPLPPGQADVQGMASWGQGERGAEGYYDHGESELPMKEEPEPGMGQQDDETQGE